jgi:type IV pilus assembly protein PilM
MGLFSSQSASYLGVDLGLGGVKIVELKNNKGRAQLVSYGFAQETEELTNEEYFGNPDRLAVIIKQICEKSNMTSKTAISALPTYNVFDSVITLPQMPQKELEKAIKVEATKLISRPMDEMELYWNILNQEELENNKKLATEKGQQKNNVIISKESNYLKILISAAPKEIIKKHEYIFQKAGIKLFRIETASLASTRSLVGRDLSQILILDIGYNSTEIIILNKGIPVFTRSINIGGHHFTKELQKFPTLDLQTVEQLKIDLSNENSPETKIIKSIDKVISPILNEINYSIKLYFNRKELYQDTANVPIAGDRIEKIIMTGGGSLLAGLNSYIENSLQTRTFTGDPWARVIYPQELKPVLDEIGPRYAVAIGLAMREIH